MSGETKGAAKSIGIVFILSIFVSVLSFVSEILFANYFGVSAQTDAFTIASQIPNILFAVVTTSISTTVIPIYTEARRSEEPNAAKRFISKFVTLILLVACGFVLIAEILAPWIVRLFSPGISDETFGYAVAYIRILFPVVLFTPIMSIFSGVLQSHKQFGRYSWLAVIRQVTYILMILVAHRFWGIYAAVFGFLVAAILEMLFSFLFSLPLVKIKPDFRFKDPRIYQTVRMSVPIFLGVGASEINRIVDKIVASFLETGNISMLNYASKLSTAFSTLIITSISTVMFPYFSDLAAKKDRSGLSKTFGLTMSVYLLITVPIIAGGIVLRQNLVELVFMRGAFTQENAVVVSGLFAGYLFAMLFSALRQTGAKLFYAMGNTKTPMYNTLFGIGVNIILNIVLGYFFGAFGLVCANVTSTTLIAILLLVSASKHLEKSMWKSVLVTGIKTLLAAVVMAAVILILLPLLGGLGKLLATVLAVLIGIAIYGVMLVILRTKEIKDVLSIVKSKLGKS